MFILYKLILLVSNYKSIFSQVRGFVKKLQAAKRSEIERQIGNLHDDSGVESTSRSTTPTSDAHSVSPVPFARVAKQFFIF